MSEDYREEFIKALENKLISYDPKLCRDIIETVIITLDDYNISRKTTEIIPYDDFNERMIKRFIACYRIEGKSEGTINIIVRTVRELISMTNKNLTDIGVYDIRLYLAYRKDTLCGRTLENNRSYLSSFFQWLVNEDIINKNPLSAIRPIKYHREVKQPFSSVEIDALRSACKNYKERAIIELLLSSGIRVSELTFMNISDIDQTNLSVHIINGKGNKERIAYTTELCMSHILRYINNRKENGDILFYNKNHDRICKDGVEYLLKQIGKRAGVSNVHPHRFRRTFATNLANRGMPIQDIQKLLGHSDINTTKIYVTLSDDKVKNSYKRYVV